MTDPRDDRPLDGEPEEPTEETFDVEASSTADDPAPAAPDPKPESESYEVADDEPAAADDATAHDREPCPNCGTPLPDSDSLVCLRCGFDLKSLTVIETATGVEEPESAEPAGGPLLSAGGRGGMIVPAAISVLAGAVLLVGYLAGAAGLYPPPAEGAEAVITGGMRFEGLFREAARVLLLTLCGCVSLLPAAYLIGRQVGDLRLCAVRVVTIVVVMRLAAFTDIDMRSLEWTVEAVMHAAIFVPLTAVLFGLSMRDVGTYGLVNLVVFLVLWVVGAVFDYGFGL